MLKEKKGWVIFNYTPRGENHATDMYDYISKKPEYIASRLTIEDTGVVKPEDLQQERERGVPEEIIQQEYYCSREGAIYGSYYGDILKQNKNNVGEYPYDEQYPVHTIWDLGIDDAMSIWFVQFVQHKIHIIDFYENNNYGLGHYADIIKGKKYRYAMHHLPHDGTKRQLTTEQMAIEIDQQLKNLEISPITIHEKRGDLYGAIQAVRGILSRCFFDKTKTKDGYDALKQYRREYDEGRHKFKDTPYHDWTSHAADAFSILPMIETSKNKSENRKSAPPKKWDGRFR
jgi:hypothetical protein